MFVLICRLVVSIPIAVAFMDTQVRLIAPMTLTTLLEHFIGRILRAKQGRTKHHVKIKVAKLFAGSNGFCNAAFTERDINPAREAILKVPNRFTMTEQDKIWHKKIRN
jgi:hypothetical protein